MKPVNSTFIQSMVAIMAIFMSVQLTYSQSCITCDNNNIKAGFGNAVNSAYSNQSILGNGNTTGRNNAVAIGTASQANWSHSYVFGSSSVTNGMHAYAIGSNAVAQSTSSFAIGNYAKSMFGNAHSIGNFTTSNQVGAYVFGLGISDVYPLINTTTNSLVVGFKSQYPTLFVSETASGDQSGRVGIGNVTDPQAKLHIRADDGEDASLLLESGSSNHEANIRLGQNHKISATEAGNLNFETADNKHFVFHQGDIFLEDIQSGIIMKSPNGQCWRGTLNDQGMLNFSQTTCPEGTSTAVQSHNSDKLMLVYPNPAGDKVTVEVSLHGQAAVLQLTSQDGKVLRQQILNTNIAQISLSQLPRGMYLINLLQDGKTLATGKVVKE